jgi:hypothetical protein
MVLNLRVFYKIVYLEWSIAEKNLFVDSIIKTNCNLELIQTIIYSRTFVFFDF